MFLKWSKKWAAKVQREEGAGAGGRAPGRLPGQAGGAGAEAGVGSSQRPLESEQLGRFQRCEAWMKGVREEKRAVEGPREPRPGRRGGDSGPTPSQAPLLNYL